MEKSQEHPPDGRSSLSILQSDPSPENPESSRINCGDKQSRLLPTSVVFFLLPSSRFHTRQLLKSYVASTKYRLNRLSSVQNILCCNILGPFARASRMISFLTNVYIYSTVTSSSQFSFTKLQRNNTHSLHSLSMVSLVLTEHLLI
jgi:hypothetical protein